MNEHYVIGSRRQKCHYESIHDSYEMHYFDSISLAYRDQFLLKELLTGLDLNNCYVAELACGSGYNSLLLKKYFPTARLIGFDISEPACEAYKRIVQAPAIQADLTKEFKIDRQFDALLSVGLLHHCISDLDQTVLNCAELLRPGGFFIMIETNKKFFLESLRRFWYRHDRYFDHMTEGSLDHDRLARKYANIFHPIHVSYFGGPAYYFLLNSLITRIPSSIKYGLAKVLWPLERLWNKYPSKALFPGFAARWERL